MGQLSSVTIQGRSRLTPDPFSPVMGAPGTAEVAQPADKARMLSPVELG